MKKRIRLTESQLHRVIKESVKKILTEKTWDYDCGKWHWPDSDNEFKDDDDEIELEDDDKMFWEIYRLYMLGQFSQCQEILDDNPDITYSMKLWIKLQYKEGQISQRDMNMMLDLINKRGDFVRKNLNINDPLDTCNQ